MIRIDMNIPLFKIHWDEADLRAVEEIIESGTYWCTGPEIETFEKKICDYLETEHCVCFNSGGSALLALMHAYGFNEKDEIIVPSFTFIATAYAPLYVGAKPVFADIEKETFGLDPDDVREKITPKTKAVMPIHYGGFPCKINALKKICKDYDIILIEDAAEAFGAKYDGTYCGNFGDSSMFSFCQNKVFTTSEGGCIVTPDQKITEKLKLFRSYGRKMNGDYFNTSECVDYVSVGYNLRMSSILAKLGISQIEKIDALIEMRRKNTSYLNGKLEDIAQVKVPQEPSNKTFSVYQMYPILVRGGKKIRDELMLYLQEKGISTKIYFNPVHQYSVFKKLGYKDISLPVTQEVSDEVLSLPMYPNMERKEMDYIVKNIKEFFEG